MKKNKLFKTFSSVIISSVLANTIMSTTVNANHINRDNLNNDYEIMTTEDLKRFVANDFPVKTMEEMKNAEDGIYTSSEDNKFAYIKQTLKFNESTEKEPRDYVFVFDSSDSTDYQENSPASYDKNRQQPVDKILEVYNKLVDRMSSEDTITLIESNLHANVNLEPTRKLTKDEAKGALFKSPKDEKWRRLKFNPDLRLSKYPNADYITAPSGTYNTESLFETNNVYYNRSDKGGNGKAIAILLYDELWSNRDTDDNSFIPWVQEYTSEQHVYSFYRDELMEDDFEEGKRFSDRNLNVLKKEFKKNFHIIHENAPAMTTDEIVSNILKESFPEGYNRFINDNSLSITGNDSNTFKEFPEIISLKIKNFNEQEKIIDSKKNNFTIDKEKIEKIEYIIKVKRGIHQNVLSKKYIDIVSEDESSLLNSLTTNISNSDIKSVVTPEMYTISIIEGIKNTFSIPPLILHGETIAEEESIEFETIRRPNANMYEDEPEKVVQEGKNGRILNYTVKIYKPDGSVFYEGPIKTGTTTVFGETIVDGRKVDEKSVSKIIEYGTKKRESLPPMTITTPPHNEDATSRENLVVKEVSEVVKLDFSTENIDDPNIKVGDSVVQTNGEQGEKVITYEVTYRDGKEISRSVVSEKVTKQPINKVIKNGTKPITERTSENISEKEPIPFKTIEEKDNSLTIGETKIKTQGVNGEKEVTYVIVKEGDVVISRNKSSEKTIKEPIDKVVLVGTKPLEYKETDIPFDTIYLEDNTLEKGQTIVVVEGKYGKEKDGKVIVQPQNKVVKVGTKEIAIETIKIPFNTILEKDGSLLKGESLVVVEGVDGEKTLDGKIIKEPISKVIKVGVKENIHTIVPFETEYIEDNKLEYGRREVIQEGVNGEKDADSKIIKSPLKAIIKVGTKTSVTEEILKPETIYKHNKELKPYEEKVVQDSKDGLKTTTKTYMLDTKTGEVKETISVEEEPAVNKIVEIGKELAKIKELPSTGVSTTSTWAILATSIIGVIATVALTLRRKKS